MLCQNSDAARHELEFDQVYYALRQIVGADGRKALRQQIILDENAINLGCGLPIPGADDQTVPAGGAACYGAGMDKLSADLRQRLSGVALEEASRDIDSHIALQRRLRDLGYLPAGTITDGVYGEATRVAIKAWQQAAGRPQAGFISDGDAFTLRGSAARAPDPAPAAAGQDAGGQGTGAQGTGSQDAGGGLVHTARTVYACANPRATRALNNAADPRQSDPGWVAYVRTDGRCFRASPEQNWERISTQDGLLLLRLAAPVVGEPPLFFRPEDIAGPAPVSAPDPAPDRAPDGAITGDGAAIGAPATDLPRQALPDPAEAPEAVAVPETLPAVVNPTPVPAPPVQPGSPQPPTGTATEGGHGGGILLLVLLIAGSVFAAVMVARNRAQRREREAVQHARDHRHDRALRITTAEIEQQHRALHVRRLQLVIPDIYGTEDLAKWAVEKERFITTRIKPLLASEGLSDQWDLIRDRVEGRIELAAQAPLPGGDAATFVSDPRVFDPRMTPQDYEHHCALLLRSAGWEARTTVASGDQGADVIASRNGKVLVLQCKLYSQSVGNAAVQEVSAARLHQRADHAAVVSNAAFTPAARQLAQTNRIALLHHDELPVFEPETGMAPDR